MCSSNSCSSGGGSNDNNSPSLFLLGHQVHVELFRTCVHLRDFFFVRHRETVEHTATWLGFHQTQSTQTGTVFTLWQGLFHASVPTLTGLLPHASS